MRRGSGADKAAGGLIRCLSSREDLIGGDDQLQQDQQHDDHFEPQRALGVDHVGERVGGFADHRELAVERGDAILELVFLA